MASVDWNMVSVVAQSLGFAGVIWGLVQNRRALQTQVAMEFYRRFEAIITRMPNELRLAASQDEPWSTLTDDRRSAIKLGMIQYLNLCSEEYALFRQRRLPRDVWRVSKFEIQRNFRNVLWRDVWRDVRDEYRSDKRFMSFMECLISTAATK